MQHVVLHMRKHASNRPVFGFPEVKSLLQTLGIPQHVRPPCPLLNRFRPKMQKDALAAIFNRRDPGDFTRQQRRLNTNFQFAFQSC